MVTIAKGYLGIDNGTHGLSVIFTDEDLNVLATGEGSYGFVDDLESGCFEQRCEDWDNALSTAMESVHQQMAPAKIQVVAIGISGQMHGEVLINESGQPAHQICTTLVRRS